jgi:hypothetical protein
MTSSKPAARTGLFVSVLAFFVAFVLKTFLCFLESRDDGRIIVILSGSEISGVMISGSFAQRKKAPP